VVVQLLVAGGEAGRAGKLRAEATMRRVIVAMLLVCGCEEPRRAPVSQDGVTKLAPPTAEQVAAARRPTTPQPQTATELIAVHIAAGTVTDDEAKDLYALALPNAKKITFAHLKKNANRYKGEPWGFTGRILEIGENDGQTVARIGIDSYGQNVMWVQAPFETDFVESNRVDVLGVLTGSYSYTSQAGWNISIPAIIAARIVKPGTGKFMPKKRHATDDDDE
jgi:hypothetical protein